MKVAVVILNWNGRSLLEKFLPKVIAYSGNATIYVADNASTDDSVAYLSENFPEVNIIENKVNGGYAKGYNDALKNLSEDIFILLNSDVAVTPNWIGPVVSEFEKDADVAAAQPKILDYNNKDYFEYAGAAGGFIDKYGFPYCRGRIFETLEKDTGQYDAIAPIFWASGACLFVRAEAFWQAGGFDEDYFAHQEEIDFCWRLSAQNKKTIAVGTSHVYHVGGATLDAAHPQKTFLNFRNSLFNIYKNLKGARAYLIIFIRLVFDAVAGIRFLVQGKFKHFFAILRAHFSFYKNLPKMRRKRKKYASTNTYYSTNVIIFKYFIQNKRNFRQL